jgi:hypothetical protein
VVLEVEALAYLMMPAVEAVELEVYLQDLQLLLKALYTLLLLEV